MCTDTARSSRDIRRNACCVIGVYPVNRRDGRNITLSLLPPNFSGGKRLWPYAFLYIYVDSQEIGLRPIITRPAETNRTRHHNVGSRTGTGHELPETLWSHRFEGSASTGKARMTAFTQDGLSEKQTPRPQMILWFLSHRQEKGTFSGGPIPRGAQVCGSYARRVKKVTPSVRLRDRYDIIEARCNQHNAIT